MNFKQIKKNKELTLHEEYLINNLIDDTETCNAWYWESSISSVLITERKEEKGFCVDIYLEDINKTANCSSFEEAVSKAKKYLKELIASHRRYVKAEFEILNETSESLDRLETEMSS